MILTYEFTLNAKFKKNSPIEFIKLHYREKPWRLIIANNYGSPEYTSESPDVPVAVFPTWNAEKDSFELLEEMCSRPVGRDKALCAKVDEYGVEHTPVYGQEHRIIIRDIPSMEAVKKEAKFRGKKILTDVWELQKDYPGVKFHIHGTYSMAPLLNMNFFAFDTDLRPWSASGYILVPGPKKLQINALGKWKDFPAKMGYRLEDLRSPKKRCEFNIKALTYFAENNTVAPEAMNTWRKPMNYEPDVVVPDVQFKKPVSKTLVKPSANAKALTGDKVACDHCSLAANCQFFRVGSVCTLPESEYRSIASMFQSRDTDQILNGLSAIVAKAAERTEKAMAFEDDFGLDKEVTKMLNDLFRMATTFAKLNDPVLRTTGVAIQVGKVEQPKLDPKVAARQAIDYYQALGIDRSEITIDMMRDFVMAQMKELNPPDAGS